MSRLCLNLLNSLPFPSEERLEDFQQPCSPLWWARATLSAHLGELPAFTLLRAHCAPALLQAVRTFPPVSVGTFCLLWLECSLSLMPVPLLCHSPYLSFSEPSSERSPSHGSRPPLLSPGSIGWHCHAHSDYYNDYLFLPCTPKCCSVTTRTSVLFVLIPWSQITMARK